MGVKVAIGEKMLPCIAMIIIEACTIFLTIMASTAMSKLGMSSFVFVVYTNALSFILLIPYSFLFHIKDKTEEPLFTFSLLSRAFFLGLVGVTISQNLAFAGLRYSSPIVACGAANMIPAFSFIIANILRFPFLESIDGPYFWNGCNWLHPHVMKITCLYTLFGTIQSALLALFMEKDLSIWRLKLDFELLVIVLTAIFGSLVRSSVQMWCTRLKGPSYTLFFKPVGVPVASTCGCVLFAATFHYGSMLSACICGLGYYTTLWEQLKEDDTKKDMKSNESVSDEKVPLLQEKQEGDSQV
ncbi:WAT1-related protein At1g60050-like [Lycium barbarum]|uniref:WAT1-related protein At1g60050-like n=1 Tax=Lycium barbarum TaxID=112863 RepID=UPI00293F6717|nr:WAT1-related protein At1g60050-like [Lycium barbarum]